MADAICRDPNASLRARFPKTFHVVQYPGGDPIVLHEVDGRCELSSRNDVADAIVNYSQRELANNDAFHWTVREARDAADFWIAWAKRIPMPPPYLWADEEGRTFQRLPWKRGESGATPDWNELMERTSNARAFKAWIGSLFVEESDRQQYVWLYGEGQNGKGAVARFLKRVLGPAYHADSAKHARSQFWTSSFVGKRLVCFPDTNDAAFPASGDFKQLTGGDAIRCELKGKAIFTADLVCKFLFMSNRRPTLTSEWADLRRAIFCELGPIAAEDAGYEQRLWEQGGAFLTDAIQTYHELCPSHRQIPVDRDALLSWVSLVEEPFEAALRQGFTLETEEERNYAKCLSERVFSAPDQMQEFLRSYGMQRKESFEFFRYIERKYQVRKQLVRVGDNREWRWVGIKRKGYWSQDNQ